MKTDCITQGTQCSVVTQIGGKSKKEGIYVYIWLIHFILQQKLTQHCKATILQLKKKKRSNRSTLNTFIHVVSSI